MEPMNNEIVEELEYIETNFEFSDENNSALNNYLLTLGLVQSYDEVLQLTNKGEELIGMKFEGMDTDDDLSLDEYMKECEENEEF